MAPFYSLINHIQNTGNSKGDLILKLRVVRAYKMHEHGNMKMSSYEVVCHDQSGSRIHGTIRKVDYKRLKHKLVVGNIYAFIYFNVHYNNMRCKTKSNLFKFVSSARTRVTRIRDRNFPSYMFVFRQGPSLFNHMEMDSFILFGKNIYMYATIDIGYVHIQKI